MRVRWSAYAGVSVALAGGVVVRAMAQRPNFYSAAVYLAQSSANLMILTNMVFVLACTILLGLQKFLYGSLRPIEIEQLYEKAWFAVTETCLAMTVFRGEIGAWFLVMFFALLTGKVWAWIGEGRVEILEQQPPHNPRLFHTRLALSLGLSVVFDLTMLEFVVKEVLDMARPDMMIMFGFEFAVLSIISLSTAARYAISLTEIGIIRKQKSLLVARIKKERVEAAIREVTEAARQADSASENEPATQNGSVETPSSIPDSVAAQAVTAAREAVNRPIDEADLEVEGWDDKGRWVFYLDLATDFFKLVVYLSFFFILLFFYGLPIHILRDVFLTCRSFFKRIADFLRYRTATRDMNARYPDATEQEIGREDVCIICREEMQLYVPAPNGQVPNPVVERMRPKKLPCGHVLHFACLRSWLERQQICPTCRTSVVPTTQTQTRPGTGADGANGANAAQPPNNPDAAGRQARVYQFGPLRIGVGAARGNNMMEELHQQLADGQARPQVPVAAPDRNAPQQYGFGIRWEGRRRRERRERAPQDTQDHLVNAERQLQQDVIALNASMAELQTLRNMQAELVRIRAQRQANSDARAAAPTVAPSTTQVPTLHGLRNGMLSAGSEGLPAGLVLPEGWTLMPLQPVHGPSLPPAPPVAMPNLHNPIPANGMFTMPQRAPPGMVPVPLQPLHGPFAPQPPTTGHFPNAPQNVSVATGPLNLTQPSANEARNHDQAATDAAGHADSADGARSSFQQTLQVSDSGRGPLSSQDIGLSRSDANLEQSANFRSISSGANAASTESSVQSALPSWSSAPTTQSSESSADTTTGRIDQPSTSTLPNGSANQAGDREDDPRSNSSRTKNPTVEDLVEGPD